MITKILFELPSLRVKLQYLSLYKQQQQTPCIGIKPNEGAGTQMLIIQIVDSYEDES